MRGDPPSLNRTDNAPVPPVAMGGSSAPPAMVRGRTIRQPVFTAQGVVGATGVAMTTQPAVAVQIYDTATTSWITDVNYTGLVSLEIQSGNGTLVGTLDINAVAGIATWVGVILNSPDGSGNTLQAVLPDGRKAIGTANLAPTIGAAAIVAIATQPVGAASGAVLSVQPVCRILDAGGRLLTGSVLSVTASKAAGVGTLTGTVAVAAVAGVVTFTNLVMTTPGVYTLNFASGALAPAVSNPATTT